MVRVLEEQEITTSNARKNRDPRRKPYYRKLQSGVDLGFRKNHKRDGAWVLRIYEGNQKYKVLRFAAAIANDSDKHQINLTHVTEQTPLTYEQAVEAGRHRYKKWLANQARGGGKPITVREAVEARINQNRIDGKKSAQVNEYFARAHIYDHKIANIEVEKLTTADLTDWLNGVATAPKRLRAKKGQPPKFAAPPKTAEEKRRRRDTANRVWKGVLRPALHAAFKADKVTDDTAWRRIAPFEKTSRSRKRFLNHGECVRLLNACDDPALRNLVQAALFTGCRYAELANLDVADWRADLGKLHVRESKSGLERFVTVNPDGQKFFDQLAAGRADDEPLLRKPDGTRWGRGHHTRAFKAAAERAKLPGVSFHTLRHSYCSMALKDGVPKELLKDNLGHTTTRMIDITYGHVEPTYRDEILRDKTPRFEVPDSNVVSARR